MERGRTGGSVHLPPGLPAQVVQQIQNLAAAVFTHGFVDAMRPTLLLPIAVMLLGAVGCLTVRQESGVSQREVASKALRKPASVA